MSILAATQCLYKKGVQMKAKRYIEFRESANVARAPVFEEDGDPAARRLARKLVDTGALVGGSASVYLVDPRKSVAAPDYVVERESSRRTIELVRQKAGGYRKRAI